MGGASNSTCVTCCSAAEVEPGLQEVDLNPKPKSQVSSQNQPQEISKKSVELKKSVTEKPKKVNRQVSHGFKMLQSGFFESIETHNRSKSSPNKKKVKTTTNLIDHKDGGLSQSLIMKDTNFQAQTEPASVRDYLASFHTPTKDLTFDLNPDFKNLPLEEQLQKKLTVLFSDVFPIHSKQMKNGWTYRGEVKSEEPNGRGVMITNTETEYFLGFYQSGNPIYKIEYFNLAKDIHYIGLAKNYKFSGFGKLSLPGGCVYEGEFFDGLYDGHGQITYQDGSMFVGEFQKGVKQGEGMVVDAGGIITKRARYSKGVTCSDRD